MSPIPGGVVSGTSQFLRTHRSLANELPHPSETWAVAEAPEDIRQNIRKLESYDVVQVVERNATDNGTHRYRTRRSVYEWVQSNIDEPPTLGCGHSGIRNLGDGEYTCKDPECEIRVGREVAQEVIEG